MRTLEEDRKHMGEAYCYTCQEYFVVRSKYDHEEHEVVFIPGTKL